MTIPTGTIIKRDTLVDLGLEMEEVATIGPSPSTLPVEMKSTMTSPDTEVGRVPITTAESRSLFYLKTTTDGKRIPPSPMPPARIRVG